MIFCLPPKLHTHRVSTYSVPMYILYTILALDIHFVARREYGVFHKIRIAVKNDVIIL